MRFIYLSIFLIISNLTQAQIKLSLQDALSMAVKHNPFYKVEKFNVEFAKTAITTSSLHPNPTFSLSSQVVSVSKFDVPGTRFLSPDNRQMTFQISKIFQVGGLLKYKVQLAQSDFLVVTSNLNAYEWNMLGEVASKWLDVWYADEKLKLIGQARLNADTLVKINQIRLKNQVITTTEFSRTQINEEQYKLMQFSARQSLKSEQNNLALLLGRNDSILIDKKEQWFPAILPQRYDSLLHMALGNRKEIEMSRNKAIKAKIDVSLQKSIAKPQPEIGLNYSPQNRIPYMGLTVVLPLPVSDKNQGEIARAKIAVDQADATTNAYLLQVEKEVRNAFDEYNTNKNNWEKYKELIYKSEVVLQTVKMSYLKGGTTILDYLEAEKSWFDMQNQYFEATFSYRKSYLQLLFTCNYSTK